MTKTISITVIAFIVTFVSALGLGVWLQLRSIKPEPAFYDLPDIELPAFYADGKPVQIGELQGPLLINFWASWCAPCRLEHSTLLDWQSKGYQIIGVNAFEDEQYQSAYDYIKEHGDPFTQNLRATSQAVLAFGVPGLPYTLLVNEDNKVVGTFIGPVNDNSIETLKLEEIYPTEPTL